MTPRLWPIFFTSIFLRQRRWSLFNAKLNAFLYLHFTALAGSVPFLSCLCLTNSSRKCLPAQKKSSTLIEKTVSKCYAKRTTLKLILHSNITTSRRWQQKSGSQYFCSGRFFPGNRVSWPELFLSDSDFSAHLHKVPIKAIKEKTAKNVCWYSYTYMEKNMA